jgi:hypothetical protein
MPRLLQADHQHLQAFGVRVALDRAYEQGHKNTAVPKAARSGRNGQGQVFEELRVRGKTPEDRLTGGNLDQQTDRAGGDHREQEEKCGGGLQHSSGALREKVMLVTVMRGK